MSANWTAQQIEALAPDPSSVQAGRGLAKASKWVSTGRDEHTLWGECQGSGSKPYQVEIDLGEPAFQCTCPSRKFPCKHALGLFLMYANTPASVPEGTPPAWVAEWVTKREAKAQKRKEAAAAPAEVSPEKAAKTAADQARRAASREKRVMEGLADLDLWLCDLVRQGLAAAQTRPYSFWDEAAKRLVDAQAPGAARMVREMGGIANTGEGWAERLLERIGLLCLLIEGYQRQDALSEEHRADVRAAVGWTVKQDEIIHNGPGLADTWLAIGQRVYAEEPFRVQRTWLWGRQTARPAMLLSFSVMGQPFDVNIIPGAEFEAELAFYPSAYPLRAAIRHRDGGATMAGELPGYPTVAEMLSAYADALAANPWQTPFPAALAAVTLQHDEKRWYARDGEGRLLPLAPEYEGGWRLMALGGGRPIRLFGEWDGAALLPLSAWAEQRFVLA